VSRTWQKKQGLIAGGIVATVHMLFLLYLHFAYHQVNPGTSTTFYSNIIPRITIRQGRLF
jgi:hypothetical protein